jgi:PAS domain S-box-containing protein
MACQDLDRDGVIRRINTLYSDLLGYDDASVIGRHVWDLIAPEEAGRAHEGYTRKLNGKRHLLPFERSYLHAGGDMLTLQVHDLLVLDQAGEAIGMRSALVDVSKRRQVEVELRAGKAFAEALIGALPDGIVVADVLGTVTSMNTTAEKLAGRTEDDSIGCAIEEVLGVSQPAEWRGVNGVQPAVSLLAALFAAENGTLHLSCKTRSHTSNVTLSCIVDSANVVISVLAVLR